jgi:hypothetical protein
VEIWSVLVVEDHIPPVLSKLMPYAPIRCLTWPSSVFEPIPKGLVSHNTDFFGRKNRYSHQEDGSHSRSRQYDALRQFLVEKRKTAGLR